MNTLSDRLRVARLRAVHDGNSEWMGRIETKAMRYVAEGHWH